MTLITPHGGRLIHRQEDAPACIPASTIQLTPSEWLDLGLIGCGAYSPLEGFMDAASYRSVLASMRLPGGLPWAIPITLAVDDPASIDGAREVGLLSPEGELVGLLEVTEIHERDAEAEAVQVYGTTDPAHPGVAAMQARPTTLLAGPVTVYRSWSPPVFSRYLLSPQETRVLFIERGWREVVAFQTRNPLHRAHEYITKSALESVDGLLIHPLVGWTKADDVDAETRLACYEALLASYYPRSHAALAVLPCAMRYAGPREAIHHAIMRQNYGCSHIIIGRDHAGVGSYYGTYDAHHVFRRFHERELRIHPMLFEYTFYCRLCDGMASRKTCPHGAEAHVTLSGSRVRELLARGEAPPPEITRPEVARLLMQGTEEPPGHAG